VARNKQPKLSLLALAAATAVTSGGLYALAAAAQAASALYGAIMGKADDQSGLVLGANAFNKEERIAFENLLEAFDDALVLSRMVQKYRVPDTEMERTADVIWRPQPYIAQSFTGTNMTANFKDNTQLSVPATLGFSKSVPWTMTAKELRDALQEQRLGEAARQKLASDINLAINNVASLQGTLVVKRTAAASGFDDVAQCEAIMNEQGVPMWDRFLGLSTRDYNSAASSLSGRGTVQGIVQKAYEKAIVAEIAGFQVAKMDYTPRLALAAGGAITLNGANQYFTPRATSTAGTGEVSNVDNRYQNLTVTATAGVKAGDCFTIANVNACHHITKQDTGQPKTFRVISVVSGTVLQISPPIISGGGATDAELQYQNVTATPASNAPITWLNTAAGYLNPFWQKDALEILPGRYAVPSDAGVAVMRASTDQGVELVMQKFYDINTMVTKYRLDTLFGVVNKQPEMSGVILFSQT
jgi:hypothetical protein